MTILLSRPNPLARLCPWHVRRSASGFRYVCKSPVCQDAFPLNPSQAPLPAGNTRWWFCIPFGCILPHTPTNHRHCLGQPTPRHLPSKTRPMPSGRWYPQPCLLTQMFDVGWAKNFCGDGTQNYRPPCGLQAKGRRHLAFFSFFSLPFLLACFVFFLCGLALCLARAPVLPTTHLLSRWLARFVRANLPSPWHRSERNSFIAHQI